jgi:hypothetical protein
MPDVRPSVPRRVPPPPPLRPPAEGQAFFPEHLSKAREEFQTHVHLVAHGLRAEVRQQFLARVAGLVREAVIDPELIARLGDEAGAVALRARLPRNVNVRRGDLVEILASEYIRAVLGAVVVHRLRVKPNVELPMHGLDSVGVRIVGGRPIVYKGEAKMRSYLRVDVLHEARTALEDDDGLVRAEALVMLVDEHRRAGNDEVFEALARELATRAEGLTRHVLFAAYATAAEGCVDGLVAALNADYRTHVSTLQVAALGQFVDDVYEMVGREA